MKIYKLLLVFVSCFLLFEGCDMFKLDNYESPNASFKGGIKDADTGELVETDLLDGSEIRAYELGYPEGVQIWKIKESGEFQNDLVFSAHYKIDFINCNFFPFVIDDLEIKRGENTYDFQVTPYIRIKDVSIAKLDDDVVAKFKLQASRPLEVKLKAIQLYAFSDMHVGEPIKYNIEDASSKRAFDPAVDIDEDIEYTLRINIPRNTTEFFKYSDKNYYFRVGALADVNNVGTVRHNYAPYVAIPF